MPTRTHVGQPDGVTNASMTPETNSTHASLSAMITTDRPCSASAAVRDRRPGSTTVQPSRKPVPAATNTAVSSRRPCGSRRPIITSPRPAALIAPMMTPALSEFSQSAPITGRPSAMPRNRHVAVTHALFVHTCAANDVAGEVE